MGLSTRPGNGLPRHDVKSSARPLRYARFKARSSSRNRRLEIAFMRASSRAVGFGLRLANALAALTLGFSLASCGSAGGPLGRVPADQIAPAQKADAPPVAAPDQIGSGPVKVGLILPLTQTSGGASTVGVAMRNAAELALAEAGGNDLTLIVKDDRSTPDGAATATQEALASGADLIIGPLFAPDVREAGRVAHGAGKPVIAFSTDASAGGHGVYLLSFLAESMSTASSILRRRGARNQSPRSFQTMTTAASLKPPSSRRRRATISAS